MKPVRTSLCFWTALFLALPLAAQEEVIDRHRVVAHEALVRFRESAGRDLRSALLQKHGIRETHMLSRVGIMHLRSDTQSAAALIRTLSAEPDVLYAEPNYIIHADDNPSTALPNDPQFSTQWALQNTGKWPGVSGADIEAVPAWAISTGSRSIVVGVVDSGVDYNHPDLQANVWSAPSSFTITFGPGDSITCPAGSHGYDAITNTCDPMDQYDHGTHVSGIIGAAGNNGVGVAGVNWIANILGLRFFDAHGNGTTAGAIRVIEFAIQLKSMFPVQANVRVLSNSYGGGGASQAELDIINAANSAGILYVAAAGNNSANLDTSPTYPASYNAANEIAVAATDSTDALSSFSNYSPTVVHLGAPGSNIFSTMPGGNYAYMSGTSMATPYVSGAAALVLSVCALTTADLKQLLLANTDLIPALAAKTVTGGRLNVYRALHACSGQQGPSFTLSAAPSSVTVVAGSSATSLISVAAVGGFSGTVTLGTSGLPAGVTASFTPAATAAGSNSILQLTASASASAPIFTGSVSVTGASGNLNGSVPVTLAVSAAPGFTLTAAPASMALTAGSSMTSTVSVAGTGNFTGNVALAVSRLPTGVIATFVPAAVAPGGTSTLTLKASATAALATAVPFTVTGRSGNLTGAAALNLNVTPAPSFSLSVAPASLTVAAGSNITTTVSVTGSGGFSGNVSLGMTNLQAGVTALFNPAVVAAGGTSTLTLTASSSTAATTTARPTVTGAGGNLSSSVSLSLSVTPAPGFKVTAAPASLTAIAGSTTTATISVAGTAGFNGSVTLAATGLPSGVTAAFNPTAVAPGTTSTLTLTASGSAALTTAARLTVTGTSGKLTSTVPLTLSVTPAPGYSLTATPASITVVAGSTVKTVIKVIGTGDFKGSVPLTATGLPQGVTAAFNPAAVAPGSTSTLTLTASAAAVVTTATTLTVTGTTGNLTGTVPLTFSVTAAPASFSMSGTPTSLIAWVGSPATATIGVTGTGAFNGSVAFAAVGLPAGVTAAFTPTSATPGSAVTLTLTADSSAAIAFNRLTITGASGNITSSLALSLTVTAAPGFTLSAAPSSLTVMDGTSVTTTVSIAGQGRFQGSVGLTATGLPSGATASFAPPAITPGGKSVLTLTAAPSAAATTGTITVRGVSGNLNGSIPISLAVTPYVATGFTLNAASPSITLPFAGNVSTTVTVVPAGGFTGDVRLAVTGVPCQVLAVFTPAVVKAGGTASLKLTSYYNPLLTTTLQITGASGNLSANTPVSLTVSPGASSGFQLVGKDSFLMLAPGATATTTITMQAHGGFSSTIKLDAFPPTGVTATFSPTTIVPGGTATLTLTASPLALPTDSVVVEGELPSREVAGHLRITLNNSTPGFTFETVSLPTSMQTLTGWIDTELLIVDAAGFSDDIQFTFSGLPTGVVGSFAPTISDCGGSGCRYVRFQLLAGVTAVATPSTSITITGTSGKLTASTTFKLAVAPSTFGVAPPLAGWTDSYQLTTPAGGTATATLLGYGKGKGFTISMTGAPPTATTSLVAAPPSGYDLTIATTSQTAPGCYTINYTGNVPGQQPYVSKWPLYLMVTK